MNAMELALVESIREVLKRFDAEVSTDRMISGGSVPAEDFVVQSRNSKKDEPIYIPAGEFLKRLAE